MCDGGVYRIVANIVLQKPDEFKDIIPMLVSFNMAKAVLDSIGKCVKHTCLVDALTQTETFQQAQIMLDLSKVSCSLRRFLTKMYF